MSKQKTNNNNNEMNTWLKYKLLILIVITFTNCTSQKHIAYYIINNLEFNKNMENEKFDIDFFNKNRKSERVCEFSLNDGTKIQQIGSNKTGFTEWRQPPYKFYKILYVYNPNLQLKTKGFCLSDLDIGMWEYYDEQGNKTIVNEDEKFDKFGYNQLFVFLNERGYVDIQKGDWKDVVGLGFDREKKLWKVEINNEKGHRELVINDKGYIIKTIPIIEIE